jgi:hypothetical protein
MPNREGNNKLEYVNIFPSNFASTREELPNDSVREKP